MSTAVIVAVVAAVCFLLLAMVAIGIYNGLVTRRNRFQNGFSQIDVQLRRRYDLIPNLVETAKGYMSHERETLEAVIAARNQAVAAASRANGAPGDAQAMQQLQTAESSLGGTLSRLMVVSESYPELKANANMMQLSEELTSTENRIAFARQAFNDGVTDYNTAREKFPASVIASMFQFQAAALLEETQPEVRNAPRVSFN
jgi:LemA protein